MASYAANLENIAKAGAARDPASETHVTLLTTCGYVSTDLEY